MVKLDCGNHQGKYPNTPPPKKDKTLRLQQKIEG